MRPATMVGRAISTSSTVEWTLTQQNVPNSVRCKDGSRHDGDMTLTFNPTSLRGKSTGYDNVGCPLGVPGPTNPISFTLEKA